MGFNNLVQYGTPIEDLHINKCHIGTYLYREKVIYSIIGVQIITFIYNFVISCETAGRLYGKLFYKTKCRMLFIEDTPIKEIDDHTFYGINETLQELHMVCALAHSTFSGLTL